jgi:Arc/MetJ-type ribon-helix-helix transcriptional regulator
VVLDRAISIRLDEEAREALQSLTRSGRSQSEAVREAIIELAKRGRRGDLAAEAERLNADAADRAEKAAIAELMESLRAAG